MAGVARVQRQRNPRLLQEYSSVGPGFRWQLGCLLRHYRLEAVGRGRRVVALIPRMVLDRQAAFDRLVQIAQEFVHGFALGRAARKSRDLGPKATLFGLVDHDLDLHLCVPGGPAQNRRLRRPFDEPGVRRQA
jgi:hypothetical protein